MGDEKHAGVNAARRWGAGAWAVPATVSVCYAALKSGLRESVPLGRGKHAGVNAASSWGAGGAAVYEAMVVCSVRHTLWPKSVCDVAGPCGFAWRRRRVCLCESVPLEGEKVRWRKCGVSLGRGMSGGVYGWV